MKSKKSTQIAFGLRNKKNGKMLGVSTESNVENTIHRLDDYPDSNWEVQTAEHAEYVRLHTSEWYVAGYDTPINIYKPSELEVVKIVKSIEPINIEIPNDREILRLKYEKTELSHLKHLIKQMDNGVEINVSLYDLKQVLNFNAKGKKKKK